MLIIGLTLYLECSSNNKRSSKQNGSNTGGGFTNFGVSTIAMHVKTTT